MSSPTGHRRTARFASALTATWCEHGDIFRLQADGSGCTTYGDTLGEAIDAMLVEWAEGAGSAAAAAEWPVPPEEGPYWAALVVKQALEGSCASTRREGQETKQAARERNRKGTMRIRVATYK